MGLNRIAFFLNNLFDNIGFYRRGFSFIIDKKKYDKIANFMSDKVIGNNPSPSRFTFTFGLDSHSYFTNTRR